MSSPGWRMTMVRQKIAVMEGYQSVSAFSTALHRMTGAAPTIHLLARPVTFACWRAIFSPRHSVEERPQPPLAYARKEDTVWDDRE